MNNGAVASFVVMQSEYFLRFKKVFIFIGNNKDNVNTIDFLNEF